MKVGTTVFLFKTRSVRRGENGQHDKGRFIQSLMYNGPLGGDMAGDGE
jgi:hypothetical protein